MVYSVSRRHFLAALGAFSASPTLAAPPATTLRPVPRPQSVALRAAPSVESLIKGSRLSGAVGFAVADPNTGTLQEGHGSTTALPPASVTKSITALYALDKLGPNYRFQTRLIATGPIENGVLKGNLVLAGGADPTLNTDGLATLARKLKQLGVNRVQGKFLIWARALPYQRQIDSQQPDHVSYNPAISGLSLNFNRVHFEWKRAGQGWGVTLDARSERYRPEVASARMKVVKRSTPVYTYKDQSGIDHWTVASEALGNGGSRWLPVRHPEAYAADVFRTMARSHGIVLDAGKTVQTLPGGSAIATHQSAALQEILRGMLKYSTNLTAEMVGLVASNAGSSQATSLKASAQKMNQWAKLNLGMSNPKLVDHSGLGDASRVTPKDMVMALSHPRARSALKPLLKNIVLRHSDGKPNTSHPLKVVAKTGTLNFASTLAGYITTQDGSELAFAIFTADQPKRRSLKKSERERPDGGRTWIRRSKTLQQKLLERWGALYGA